MDGVNIKSTVFVKSKVVLDGHQPIETLARYV